MADIEIYQNPLAHEAVSVAIAFDTALAEAPTSAVVWLERDGVSEELAATLQPGATTTACTVVWVPEGELVLTGSYTLVVRLRNASNQHIARTPPIDIDALRYPAAPA